MLQIVRGPYCPEHTLSIPKWQQWLPPEPFPMVPCAPETSGSALLQSCGLDGFPGGVLVVVAVAARVMVMEVGATTAI